MAVFVILRSNLGLFIGKPWKTSISPSEIAILISLCYDIVPATLQSKIPLSFCQWKTSSGLKRLVSLGLFIGKPWNCQPKFEIWHGATIIIETY
jgi:hypothetical protein